jgi:hypothetical protein
MNKGGRPRLEGLSRYACGKITKAENAERARKAAQAIDQRDVGVPSPKVRDERHLFNAKCFKGGGQGHHAGDAIGQLWLVGLLNIRGFDETKLLAVAREWWCGRSDVFGDVGPKVAKHERHSRGEKSTKTTKSERAYYHYENQLLAAKQFDADCLRDLMEIRDGQQCHWAARIIQDEIVAKIVGGRCAALSSSNDHQLLTCSMRALIVMAGVEAEARDQAA